MAEQRNVATLTLVFGGTRRYVLPEGIGAGKFGRQLRERSRWIELATGERIRASAVVAFSVERRAVEPGKERYL